MQTLTKVQVQIYWEENKFGAQAKTSGFFFTTQADTVAAVLENLRNLIAGYLMHEGKNNPEWKGVCVEDIRFDCEYDLAAFFEHFKDLKITAIAARAGINPNLLQQYVSGNKRASKAQTKKIQAAVHLLSAELRNIILG